MDDLLVTPKRHPSSLSALGNGSLGKSFKTMLKTKKSSTHSSAGRLERKQYDCDDDDDESFCDGHKGDDDEFSGDYLSTLKSQSDHIVRPKKRWTSTGSRRGSNDSFNDSCESLGMEELSVTHKRHPSSLSSLGSSLGQSLKSLLKTKKNSTDSSSGHDDESLSDGHEDDSDYDQFSGDYSCDNNIDEDKLMQILCKELEITCDGDDE